MAKYFEERSQQRKEMSKEDKQKIKEEKEALVEEYGWAIVGMK